MFDYVVCKMRLPDGGKTTGKDTQFQSKDGPCVMGVITIHEDGTVEWPEPRNMGIRFYGYDPAGKWREYEAVLDPENSSKVLRIVQID